MSYNISYSSELMKNHKMAEIMDPQDRFESLQTNDGFLLFFSIGTDQVLYLTREIQGNQSQWIKTDISTALASTLKTQSVTVKTFQVSQELTSGNVDMMLVCTVNGVDSVFTVSQLPNTLESWEKDIPWELQNYDDAALSISKLVVSDIYLAEGISSYFVVDILSDPVDPTSFINRYFLDPTKKLTGQVWNERNLASNYNAGQIQSCLGQKQGEEVAGIYTLGHANNEVQLIYTPLYNAFDPKGAPPSPTRLMVGNDVTAIAEVSAGGDGSILFAAGDQKLYYFASDNQQDQSTPVTIVNSEFFTGVTELHASTDGKQVAVFGLNDQKQFFYTRCAVGSELTATSWSLPLPIQSDIDQIAPLINQSTQEIVVFVQGAGDTNLLNKLTKSPITSGWTTLPILLPSSNKVLEMNTYTTHVVINDDQGFPAQGVKCQVTASKACQVDINDIFYKVDNTAPIEVTPDASGSLTLMQPVSGLGAATYTLTFDDGTKLDVNPMEKVQNTLKGVSSGSQLNQVALTDSKGNTAPLVSAADQGKSDQVASQINQVSNIDLSKKSAKPANTNQNKSNTDSGGLLSDLGDLVQWYVHVVEDIDEVIIHVAEDAFYLVIGDYQAVIKDVEDLVSTIETVVKKIEVDFEKLVQWLGFIFEWEDILKVKDYFKTCFQEGIMGSISELVSLKSDMDTWFTNIETQIKNGEINPTKQIQSQLKNQTFNNLYRQRPSNTSINGNDLQSDPKTNWVKSKLIVSGNHTDQEYKTPVGDSTEINTSGSNDPANQFATVLENIIDDFENTFDNVESQFGAMWNGEMSFSDFLTDLLDDGELLGIKSLQQILDVGFDVINDGATDLDDVLTHPIDIPFFSAIYKKVSGASLSLLDLICLIQSVIFTIIYKIVEEKSPVDTLQSSNIADNLKMLNGSLQKIFEPNNSGNSSQKMPAGITEMIQSAPDSENSSIDQANVNEELIQFLDILMASNRILSSIFSAASCCVTTGGFTDKLLFVSNKFTLAIGSTLLVIRRFNDNSGVSRKIRTGVSAAYSLFWLAILIRYWCGSMKYPSKIPYTSLYELMNDKLNRWSAIGSLGFGVSGLVLDIIDLSDGTSSWTDSENLTWPGLTGNSGGILGGLIGISKAGGSEIKAGWQFIPPVLTLASGIIELFFLSSDPE